MARAWPVLLLLVGGGGARGATPAVAMCPPEAEIRRTLGVEQTAAPIACRGIDEHTTLMGTVVLPAMGSAPHVVVALSAGNGARRGAVDLTMQTGGSMPAKADAWKVSVGSADLPGADWLRIDVTAEAGEDVFVAQTAVSFFRADGGRQLRHLWTGLGDRHENRFDACRLDTAATFRLLDSGALLRTTEATRTFEDQRGLATDVIATLRAGCVAAAPTHETFAVADDGIYADVRTSKALRARARENRRLFLRARTSATALAHFITDSLKLVPEVADAVMSASSPDQDAASATIETSGAVAYRMDVGGHKGLNWKKILSIVDPRVRPLVLALADLRSDEGAWIEARSDYGGCHQPEAATAPLRHLVDAWQAAPLPFRLAFQQVVLDDLREMSANDCFCAHPAERRELQRALDRNAAIIDVLPGGPEAASALRALPEGEGARFDCSPG